jgi:hypothetical protein
MVKFVVFDVGIEPLCNISSFKALMKAYVYDMVAS